MTLYIFTLSHILGCIYKKVRENICIGRSYGPQGPTLTDPRPTQCRRKNIDRPFLSFRIVGQTSCQKRAVREHAYSRCVQTMWHMRHKGWKPSPPDNDLRSSIHQ